MLARTGTDVPNSDWEFLLNPSNIRLEEEFKPKSTSRKQAIVVERPLGDPKQYQRMYRHDLVSLALLTFIRTAMWLMLEAAINLTVYGHGRHTHRGPQSRLRL